MFNLFTNINKKFQRFQITNLGEKAKDDFEIQCIIQLYYLVYKL